MDHQFAPPTPTQSIYRNMVAESRFYAHEEDECDVKASLASSTRSPTTVFAVDELSSVFRVADDAIERGSYLNRVEKETGSSSSRRRCLTPSSFTTDGELSTFSEDTEEGDDEDARSSDNEDHFRFPSRRRRAPLSIFRPVSGTKRACDFEEDDHDDDIIIMNSTKRRCTAPPMLLHANPIGSDTDESYSPFKRICRSSSITNSSYTPLFATTLPVRADTLSIRSQHLQHPLSFDIFSITKAADITIKADDDTKVEDGIRKEN